MKATDFRKGEFELVFEEGRTVSTAALRQAVEQSGFTTNRIVTPRASSGVNQNVALSAEEKQLLSAPQKEFRNRQYQLSLEAAQKAAEKLPKSSEIHQFLSLSYFAIGRYEDARDAARQALHLGKPWTWKQLKSHYVTSKEYTKQLRHFEQYLREKDNREEFGLFLGYHYWMLGHFKVAEKELVNAAQYAPKDKLIPELLEQLRKTAESKAPTKDSR